MCGSYLERGLASSVKFKGVAKSPFRALSLSSTGYTKDITKVQKFTNEKANEGFGIFGIYNPGTAYVQIPKPFLNWCWMHSWRKDKKLAFTQALLEVPRQPDLVAHRLTSNMLGAHLGSFAVDLRVSREWAESEPSSEPSGEPSGEPSEWLRFARRALT